MSDHALNLKRAAILFGILAVATVLAVGGALGQGSSNQYTVGVLPFADNSGSGGQDLATALAHTVQTEMAQSTKLNGRVLDLANGTSPASIDAVKAVEIGRANNVDVVLVGTVMEASSEESNKDASGPSFGGFHVGGAVRSMKATVTLQGNLYSTVTGKQIDTILVTGNASQTKVGSNVSTRLGDLSSDANSFNKSPIGKALHSAVTDLVKKVSDDQSQMARYTGGAGSSSVAAAAAAQQGSPAAANGQASANANSSSASGAAAGAQPELKSVKIDFIPGERTIFYDDFSDMAEDEPPPHWKVRGNPVELRTGGGIRELYAAKGVDLTSPSFVVPANFTFELIWTGGGEMRWHFEDKDGNDMLTAIVRGEADGKSASTSVAAKSGELGDGTVDADTNQPTEFALWAQQGRVRAYLNGNRVVDVNQVDFGQITQLYVSVAAYRPNGIRSVRVAESAPDFSSVIASTGKYVTHGIYFDTDSAILKPESAAVLKQVAGGLEKNPNLKLEIDGYTDSVGNASHNLDLSKRRAEAVRTVLVSQFGIDAGRLTSNGFGADKPIGSNDTPDGRAQNRRVEFVKQ